MDTFLPADANPNATPDASAVHAAAALQERRVHALKSDDCFAIFDTLGDVVSAPGSHDGLYFRDTRHLSRLDLLLGQERPLLLSSNLGNDNLMLTADLTNACVRDREGSEVDQGLIHIRRSIFLAGGTCFTRFGLYNHGMTRHDLRLTLRFEADFADLFEVRGMHRLRRGKRSEAVLGRDSVRIGYVGLDNKLLETLLRFDPAPESLSATSASFNLSLQPGEQRQVFLQVACAPEACPDLRPGRAFGAALLQERRRLRSSVARTATITTGNAEFDEALARADNDLRMLTTEKPTGPYPYAGIPWFSTAFGRDALITALLKLWQEPALARGVLIYLAQEQATEFDPSCDAEPGKILHEVRAGEMAELREVPFRRYYGSVDSTPLFVMLAGAYLDRTGDLPAIAALWPNIQAALAWIDGRADENGFVAYHRMTEDGLANQGWKDSFDSISHADGTLARSPISLCEVQGYVYAARRAAAGIARKLGHEMAAAEQDEAASRLQAAFEARFWVERLQLYALALDGDGAPCEVRSSNAGQVLLSGIASPERAAKVVATMMSARLFTGWGIRTLASDEIRYNPMSYHNGSVWPHDNALIAMGFARYGFPGEAGRLCEGLFAACGRMELKRLPELFCGFSRRLGRDPTAYPVACTPQAWAAATFPALVQSCLGLSFQPATGTVRFDRPSLPQFLDMVTVHNLSLNAGQISAAVRRVGGAVSVEALARSGGLLMDVTL